MKIKEKIKSNKFKDIFFWFVIGILSSLLSHFIIELLHFNYEIENVLNFILIEQTGIFLLGSAFLFVFYMLFSSLFGSSIFGSLILILMSWLVGMATNYKFLFREEPLFPNELYMIKEIPFLIEMIGIPRAMMILAVLIISIVLLILLYRRVNHSNKQENSNKIMTYILRGLGIVLATGLLFYTMHFNYPNNKIKNIYNDYASWITYNQNMNYKNNGFIAGFLFNFSAPAMEIPESYSKETMEEIFGKYKNSSIEVNQSKDNNDLDTNILFVMNETFTDPFNLNEIESNKDPLPYYRQILQESVHGNVMAPTIGGGTANNEFQALTGFSMAAFDSHITSPYVQLVNQLGHYPSIVNKFNDFNYYTTAIHPYSPSLYRRTDVYNNLEFDEFRHENNMNHRDKISEKHRYISDFSAYEEVFYVLSETEEPDFVHLVTMQNHGPYAVKYDEVDYEVEGTGNNVEANPYFKDLENSDISLELLTNKIDEYPEPILLIFWGDHLPGFYEDNIFNNNTRQAMHETPFLIYSNEYNLQEEEKVISPIYLSNYLADILDIQITPYQAMLTKLQDELPILENGLYLETETSNKVKFPSELTESTKDILKDYLLLVYDITTGNQYAHDIGFFEYYE